MRSSKHRTGRCLLGLPIPHSGRMRPERCRRQSWLLQFEPVACVVAGSSLQISKATSAILKGWRLVRPALTGALPAADSSMRLTCLPIQRRLGTPAIEESPSPRSKAALSRRGGRPRRSPTTKRGPNTARAIAAFGHSPHSQVTRTLTPVRIAPIGNTPAGIRTHRAFVDVRFP